MNKAKRRPPPIEDARFSPMRNLTDAPPPTKTEVRALTDGYTVRCSVCAGLIGEGERYIRAFSHEPPPAKGLVLRMHYECTKAEAYPHRGHRLVRLARMNYEKGE